MSTSSDSAGDSSSLASTAEFLMGGNSMRNSVFDFFSHIAKSVPSHTFSRVASWMQGLLWICWTFRWVVEFEVYPSPTIHEYMFWAIILVPVSLTALIITATIIFKRSNDVPQGIGRAIQMIIQLHKTIFPISIILVVEGIEGECARFGCLLAVLMSISWCILTLAVTPIEIALYPRSIARMSSIGMKTARMEVWLSMLSLMMPISSFSVWKDAFLVVAIVIVSSLILIVYLVKRTPFFKLWTNVIVMTIIGYAAVVRCLRYVCVANDIVMENWWFVFLSLIPIALFTSHMIVWIRVKKVVPIGFFSLAMRRHGSVRPEMYVARDGSGKDEMSQEIESYGEEVENGIEKDCTQMFDTLNDGVLYIQLHTDDGCELLSSFFMKLGDRFEWSAELIIVFAKHIFDRYPTQDTCTTIEVRRLVEVFKKFKSRMWDVKMDLHFYRLKRLEADKSIGSKTQSLRHRMKYIDSTYREGLLVLANFWKSVADQTMDMASLNGFVHRLQTIEEKGIAAFEHLTMLFRDEPVVFEKYASFVEDLVGDRMKALQLIQTLESLRGDGVGSDGPETIPERRSQQGRQVRISTHNLLGMKQHEPGTLDPSSSPRSRRPSHVMDRKKSIVDGTLSEAVQEADSIDVERIRRYREANRKSRTVSRLRGSVLFVLLVSFLAIVVLFVVALVVIKPQFASDGIDPKEGGGYISYQLQTLLNLRGPLSRMSSNVRLLQQFELQNDTSKAGWVDSYASSATEIFDTSFRNLMDSGHMTEHLDDAWEDTTLVKEIVDLEDGNFTLKERAKTAYVILSVFPESATRVRNCLGTIDGDASKITTTCLNLLRYLVVNCNHGFSESLDGIESAYEKSMVDRIETIEWLVNIASGLSLIVLIGVVLFVFLPELMRIRSENRGVHQVFSVVPKAEAWTLHRMARDRAQKLDNLGSKDESGSAGNPTSSRVITSIVVRFFFCVFMLLLVASVFPFITLIHLEDDRIVGHELKVFVEFQSAMWVSYDDFMEIAVKDTDLWAPETKRGELSVHNDIFRASWKELLFQNPDSVFVPGLLYRSDDFTKILMDGFCDNQENMDCKSMNDVVNGMMRNNKFMATQPIDTLTMNSPTFIDQTYNYAPAGQDRIDRITQAYKDYYGPRVDSMREWVIIVFAVFVPLAILLYFILLRQSVQRLEKHHSKTRKLLLLLPEKVIDASPIIRQFIAKGDRVNENELQNSMIQSEKKMSAILQTTKDAFIEVGGDGMIKEVNKSAEVMFGLSKSKIAGECVEILFVDPDNMVLKQLREGIGLSKSSEAGAKRFGVPSSSKYLSDEQEVRCRRGKDEEFWAAVTFSGVDLGSERVVAMFVKDVTGPKKQKAILDEEKKKSNDLLLNILPHGIAERLKGGEKLIADRHENCCVLFTDIKNFTSMVSHMGPAELVELLQRLITSFDELVDQYKVMKIKTIGDAYMAVMGLEEHILNNPTNVIRMGREMVEKAKEVGVSIRVGIHVGDLVAGVVGAKKFAYDIWGTTVNYASRMESSGIPDFVQVSRAMFERTHDTFIFEERRVKVKGFDEEQAVYLCKGER